MTLRALLSAALLVAFPMAYASEAPPDLSSLRGRVDLYGSVSSREDARVSIEVRDLFAGTTRSTATGDAPLRGGGGVRGVAWQEGKPWALGADLGYLDTRGARLEAHVVPLSVFAGIMGTPPAGSAAPARRPYPYLFAGFTTFMAWGNATAGSLSSRFRTGDWWLTGSDRPTSSYFAAGATWPLSEIGRAHV